MRHFSKRHTSFFSVKTIALLLIVTLTSVTSITYITKVSATEEDVTPPVLHDIWISPSVINDGESITIYANVTDDISGINFVFPTVRSESGNQWIQFGGLNYNSSSGLWEKEVTIPQYSEAGTWIIPYVECGDFVENRAWYEYGIDYIANFTVNSLTPDTGIVPECSSWIAPSLLFIVIIIASIRTLVYGCRLKR